MKKILAVTAAALVIGSSSFAFAMPPQARNTPPISDTTMMQLAAYMTTQSTATFTANDYIGKDVANAQGDNIGSVKDLVIEQNGGVLAAVVGVGGFLGVGEKNVAVPISNIVALRDNATGDVKLSTLETKETLQAAPSFMPITEQRADASTSVTAMPSVAVND